MVKVPDTDFVLGYLAPLMPREPRPINGYAFVPYCGSIAFTVVVKLKFFCSLIYGPSNEIRRYKTYSSICILQNALKVEGVYLKVPRYWFGADYANGLSNIDA